MEKYEQENIGFKTFVSRANVLAQRRQKIAGSLKRKILSNVFSRKSFLLLASFLLGRALLFDELAPFGLAYWTILYRDEREASPPAAIILLIGSLTSRSLAGAASLLTGMFVVVLTERLLETKFKKGPLILTCVLGIALGRLPLLAFNSFLPYDLFLTVMEALLVIPVAVFLSFSIPAIWQGKEEDARGQEEITGSLFLFAFLLLGLGEGPFWVLSLQGILIQTVVILLAYLYGGALGAAAGLALGIFVHIGSENYYFIFIIALAGLIAGIFREAGKKGTAAGYLVGLVLSSLYIGGGSSLDVSLLQGIVAAGSFLLLPVGFLTRVKDFSPAFGILTGNGTMDEEIRYNASRRLKEYAQVFKEVAAVFRETPAAKGPAAAESYYQKMAAEACCSCGNYKSCWKEAPFLAVGMLEQILSQGEEGDKVTIRDFPLKLRQKCRYPSRLIRELNKEMESYRATAAGEKRLKEGRAMVVGQLEGLAGIINDFANEVKLKLRTDPADRQACAYTVEMGVAQIPKEGEAISGDYYSLLSVAAGLQVIILSDGMGSGENAKSESKATVQLLENLLEAGFNRDLVFKTVNTIIKLRSPRESFATVDLAIIDLINGKLDIYKTGAAPSYMKRGRQVKEITGSSLPLGILAEVEIEIKQEKLADGDILVLVTDGVTEAGVKINNMPAWVRRMLAELKHSHPQIIADTLLKEALNRNQGKALDDLTVIVCKALSLGSN